MAFLIYNEGSNRGKRIELPSQDIISLGRSAERCDIVVEGDTISGKHCTIERGDACFIVKDLDSTNKTWVNGEPILAAEVYRGDTISLGDTELLLDGDDVPEAPAPAETGDEPIYSDSGTKVINVVPRNVRDGKVKLPTDFKHHNKHGKKIWLVFVGIAVLIILWLLFQYETGL